MKQIKAVIFDFGGVVHSLGKRKLSQIIAERTGWDCKKIESKILPLLVYMDLNEIDEKIFWKKLGVKIKGIWEDEFRDYCLNPEIIDLAIKLKKQGLMTAVLSNTMKPHNCILKKRRWYEVFDRVFLSYKIGLMKPDIKAYELVLKELGLSGNECIYIDDLEENLVPARELGMKTVLAENPDQVVKEVNKMLS